MLAASFPMKILAIIWLMLLGLACTSNSSPKAKLPLSDTAKVLQAVFDNGCG